MNVAIYMSICDYDVALSVNVRVYINATINDDACVRTNMRVLPIGPN